MKPTNPIQVLTNKMCDNCHENQLVVIEFLNDEVNMGYYLCLKCIEKRVLETEEIDHSDSICAEPVKLLHGKRKRGKNENKNR